MVGGLLFGSLGALGSTNGISLFDSSKKREIVSWVKYSCVVYDKNDCPWLMALHESIDHIFPTFKIIALLTMKQLVRLYQRQDAFFGFTNNEFNVLFTSLTKIDNMLYCFLFI
jgi:hypothetical protein